MSTDAQIEELLRRLDDADTSDGGNRARLLCEQAANAIRELRAALAAAQAGAPDWQQLEEWIVMADNRLEVADCPGCVDVARSYLQEALTTIRSLRPAAQAESEVMPVADKHTSVATSPLSASEPAGAPSEEAVRRLLDHALLVIERTGHMNFVVRGKPFKTYMALLRRGGTSEA